MSVNVKDRVLEKVQADPKMSKTMTLQFASKMRRVYGDEETAKRIEKIAEGRDDPNVEPPFFCYECGGAFCEHAPDQGLLKSPSWVNDLEVAEPESEE
jgi:hypothetical protein